MSKTKRSSRKDSVIQPWDFVPVNDDTRYNFPVGAGTYSGHGVKAKQGRIRSSSVVYPAKDKK